MDRQEIVWIKDTSTKLTRGVGLEFRSLQLLADDVTSIEDEAFTTKTPESESKILGEQTGRSYHSSRKKSIMRLYRHSVVTITVTDLRNLIYVVIFFSALDLMNSGSDVFVRFDKPYSSHTVSILHPCWWNENRKYFFDLLSARISFVAFVPIDLLAPRLFLAHKINFLFPVS